MKKAHDIAGWIGAIALLLIFLQTIVLGMALMLDLSIDWNNVAGRYLLLSAILFGSSVVLRIAERSTNNPRP